MEKQELYKLLDIEREVVIDPQAGEWAGNLAWRRINELLDCLSQLNLLESQPMV